LNSGKISGNNQAFSSGGGVQNHGMFSIFGGEISDNIAEYQGGGVWNIGTFEMFGGKITNNTATSGGGVDNDNIFVMYGGVIDSNIASEWGGGVCNSFDTFSVVGDSCVISNNRATNGGGVYISSGQVDLLGGMVLGNVASGDGGGVWVTNTNALVEFRKLAVGKSVVFSNNSASIAYDRLSVHNKVYNEQIKSKQWTAPFKQGYNNYDISYLQDSVVNNEPSNASAGVLTSLSAILLILFILLFVPVVYKAKKKPNKANYSVVAVFCLFILGSVFGVLGHFGGGILIMLVAVLLCFILIIVARENFDREMTEQMKRVDVLEPIRVKDFFVSWNLLLKLKRKYGARNAQVINFLFITGLVVVTYFIGFYLIEKLILVNDRLYRGGFGAPMLIGLMFGLSISLYFNQKRALKNFESLSTPTKGWQANFCTRCGAPVVADARFCTRCGKQLQSSL